MLAQQRINPSTRTLTARLASTQNFVLLIRLEFFFKNACFKLQVLELSSKHYLKRTGYSEQYKALYQALDTDYKGNTENLHIDRGHLMPNGMANQVLSFFQLFSINPYFPQDELMQRTTFTLTNVAPQYGNFNQGYIFLNPHKKADIIIFSS